MTVTVPLPSGGERAVQDPDWHVAYVTIKGRVIGAHGPFYDRAAAQDWVNTIATDALYGRELWSIAGYGAFRKAHPRLVLIRIRVV